jgi:hypothetical protein
MINLLRRPERRQRMLDAFRDIFNNFSAISQLPDITGKKSLD